MDNITLKIDRLGDNSLLGTFVSFCIDNGKDFQDEYEIIFEVKYVVLGVNVNLEIEKFEKMFPRVIVNIDITL